MITFDASNSEAMTIVDFETGVIGPTSGPGAGVDPYAYDLSYSMWFIEGTLGVSQNFWSVNFFLENNTGTLQKMQLGVTVGDAVFLQLEDGTNLTKYLTLNNYITFGGLGFWRHFCFGLDRDGGCDFWYKGVNKTFVGTSDHINVGDTGGATSLVAESGDLFFGCDVHYTRKSVVAWRYFIDWPFIDVAFMFNHVLRQTDASTIYEGFMPMKSWIGRTSNHWDLSEQTGSMPSTVGGGMGIVDSSASDKRQNLDQHASLALPDYDRPFQILEK